MATLLIQIALAHYQFEAIHPFLDGNGRVGRLLITLFLVEREILPTPLLYLSAFFEATRQEYYARLLAVTKQDDWVAIAGYQDYDTKDLIEFWRSINNHASVILLRISKEAAQRKCDTNDPEPRTIEWLAVDYIKHLLHHLHQILNLEPIAYP